MKKYLFGLFALVLAVGFSAFTSVNDNATTDYFWYSYDPTMEVLTDDISQELKSHEDAVQLSPCPDAGAIDCARAFSRRLTSSELADATLVAGIVQDVIKKQ